MILMLNCSYKSKDGNTQYFLDVLKKEIREYTEQTCKSYKIKNVLENSLEPFAEELRKTNALIIGAPLYVDGLPAQAVKWMEMMLEKYKGDFSGVPVYVVSNLGFYEAEQVKHLFSIVENWCRRMDMTYGGGLAVGAGPMISTLKKMSLKTGLNKDIGNGFENLALAVSKGERMENYYSRTAIPRLLYIKAAHMTFRKTMKKNGVR